MKKNQKISWFILFIHSLFYFENYKFRMLLIAFRRKKKLNMIDKKKLSG